MSVNMFEDQLNFCRDSFEEEHLQGYTKRVAVILDFSNPKFCIKLATKKGENYMGIVYRVTIEGEKNGVEVKISTVLKVPPRDEISRRINLVRYLFPREKKFYSDIVPLLNELLKTRNKTLENIPTCYFTSDVDHKEAIYLEDLQPLGFKMRDRIKQLDFPHMSLAFRALGRFHALSFALRDQRPRIFANKIAGLEEPVFNQNFLDNQVFIDKFRSLGNLVKMALAEEDPRYTERFTEFAEDFLDQIKKSCSGVLAEPYAVLAHGDLWTNNLLFKYGEDSVEPQDLYFLDFQAARYASPATDISYTMYTSCSQQLREKHFDELIRIYHKSLSAYLRELGSDPENLFPYDALLDHLKKFSRIAAITVTLLLSSLTSQGEDVKSELAKHSDISMLEERIRRDHFWRNNLRDSIKDLIDRNYI